MNQSLHVALGLTLIALLSVTPAAGDEPAATKPAEGFTIVRDPELGKPLISLRNSPKDAQGRQADDVLEQFLKNVRDGEVEKAQQLCRFTNWTSKARGVIGHVTKDNLPDDFEYAKKAQADLTASEALFPKFVQELRRAKKYTLGATVGQKSNYWTIRVVADGVEKQPWPYAVYLHFENKKWTVEIGDLAH